MKLLLFTLCAAGLFGQTDWPSYNGDYSGRRYSTLEKINQSNINALSLAWVYRPNPGREPRAGAATMLR